MAFRFGMFYCCRYALGAYVERVFVEALEGQKLRGEACLNRLAGRQNTHQRAEFLPHT